MSSTNLYSFIFAGVLVAAAIFGRTNQQPENLSPTAFGTEQTSLAAEPTAVLQANLTNQISVQENQLVALDRSLSASLPTQPPPTHIDAGMVKELGKAFPIFSTNNEGRWPIASLTKLMTAIIAIERIEANRIIPISETAVSAEGLGGGLSAGERVGAQKLIELMMVVSSNDAAVALAEFYGRREFIDAMQAKAAELNLNQTTFFDETGLSTLNQSTITDLEKLVDYIWTHHPEIFSFSKKTEVVYAGQRQKNIHPFAGQADFSGGKTGFIEEARGNLISLFKLGGKPILVIVLGAEDRFEQSGILYNWVKELY